MLIIIAVLCFLMVPASCLADAIDDAITQAGLVEKIGLESDTLTRLARHRDCCVVKKHDDEVRIAQNDFSESKAEFSTKKIKYIWDNRGEFGGKLQAVWRNNRKRVLLEENVCSIHQLGQFLYVFTGLTHLGSSWGAVYKISDFDEDPKISRVTLLPGEPVALLDSRSLISPAFIIITRGSDLSQSCLFVLTNHDTLLLADASPVWNELRPSSAIQVGNRLLIGMNSGVAVVELDRFRLKKIRSIRQMSTCRSRKDSVCL